MKCAKLRAIVVLLTLFVSTQETSQYALSQPPNKSKPQRIRKIVEIAKQLDKLFSDDGPPKGVDVATWERQQMIAFARLYYDIAISFEDPWPEAVTEIILALPSQSAFELFNSPAFYEVLPSLFRKVRSSYLEALDRGDERLKDKLQEHRQKFVPYFRVDRLYLEKRFVDAKKPLPAWYLDRAFTCSDFPVSHADLEALESFAGIGFYGTASLAAKEFLFLSGDHEEFYKKGREEGDRVLSELYWSLHAVETYGFRRKHNRVQPQDAELARKQLKWLWETKRWWARRYVVEILNASPELAFEGIIEELKKEQHPSVGYRIADLKLIEKLEKQKPKP